ncbi:DUF2490 domain-containing protein [bacterium]|nr:DUF2490 domain-containing protein [bacterium]
MIIGSSGSVQAYDRPGYWLMYFGQFKLNQNFSIHHEIQHRVNSFDEIKYEQLLTRVGLNYNLTEQAMVTAGYAYIDTRLSGTPVLEHRIWQQLILRQNVGRFAFEHRYRTEQRWIEKDYKNRLRYRLYTAFPLNNPKISKGSFYLAAYDEIFIKGDANYFDQNRAYAAVGYQIRNNLGIQAGILHQKVSSDYEYNGQLALFYNPSLTRSSPPAPID